MEKKRYSIDERYRKKERKKEGKVFSFCEIREERAVLYGKDSQDPIKIDHWIFIGGRGEAMALDPSSTRLEGWWFGTRNPSICHDTIIAVANLEAHETYGRALLNDIYIYIRTTLIVRVYEAKLR